ncbi:MAG: TlpA family protein disulfide reductase [Candidatus Promineifilaceae bacterium]
MPAGRFSWSVLLLALALLGGAWIAYSREPISAAAGPVEAPLAGHLAPAFSLTSLSGEQVSLADYRGRPVVLNFWATWCPPCRQEMPALQAASKRFAGRAVILGVDQGEAQMIVADFASQLAISYPLLLDSDSAVSRAYSVTALPTTLFIDQAGVVREVFAGSLNQAIIEDRLQRLLAEG